MRAGEELIDALDHPTPERRAVALRELAELPDAELFPLLLGHLDDGRREIRRGVHLLLRGALFEGSEARRAAVVEALWDRPATARRFSFDLETCGRRFRTRAGSLALAAAMGLREDRTSVERLAKDPLGWAALERFDPVRGATLIALACVLEPPPCAGPACVAPFRGRVVAPQRLAVCFAALAAADDAFFDSLLAAEIAGADPLGLPVRVALACASERVLPECAGAVTTRLREGPLPVIRAVVRGLWSGGAGAANLRGELSDVALERYRDEDHDEPTRVLLLLAGAGAPPSEAWRAAAAAAEGERGLLGLTARLLLAPDDDARAAVAARAWEAGVEGATPLAQLYFAIRSGAPVYAPLLAHVLRADDVPSIEFVLESLPTFPRSEAVTMALVEITGRYYGRGGAWCCERLAQFDPELSTPGAAEALAAQVRQSLLDVVRAGALRGCGWLRRFPPEVADALAHWLERDPATLNPILVLATASCAGSEAKSLVPFLVGIAGGEVPGPDSNLQRAAALRALARIAPDDPRARAAFLAALSDGSDLVRESGAFAFLSVGRLAAEEREGLGRLAAADHGVGAHAIAARVLAAHDRLLAYAAAGN